MIRKISFYGGTRYICTECRAVVEENRYPPTLNEDSARFVLQRVPMKAAASKGIVFSGRAPCRCET